MAQALNTGIYLWDNMTMLDGYGPLQILSTLDEFNTFTFAKEKKLIASDCGAMLTPDHDFDSCPDLDILIAAGGANPLSQMTDPKVMAFFRAAGAEAKYVTSVCTGALILAEAGLLDGYRATTHWASLHQLAAYPEIEVVKQRVVIDRNRLTGGGITAGIDFALTLIAEVVAPPAAQAMQLLYEYNPQPPFNTGSPDTAPPEIVAMVKARAEKEIGPELQAFIDKKQVA